MRIRQTNRELTGVMPSNHFDKLSWNIFYLQICVCGVSSTLSPLYWNDDPKKSSPTLTPLNSAALSMWETPILLRYSFFLTVAPLPRTMPGNTSSQSIPCLEIFNRKNKNKNRMKKWKKMKMIAYNVYLCKCLTLQWTIYNCL